MNNLAIADDLTYFCSQVVSLVSPSLVLVTGDLTHAKFADERSSQQFEEEWRAYAEVLERTGVWEKLPWLDIRGNHGNELSRVVGVFVELTYHLLRSCVLSPCVSHANLPQIISMLSQVLTDSGKCFMLLVPNNFHHIPPTLPTPSPHTSHTSPHTLPHTSHTDTIPRAGVIMVHTRIATPTPLPLATTPSLLWMPAPPLDQRDPITFLAFSMR